MNANMSSPSSSSNEKQQQQQKWFPLESNPTLINNYLSKLGYDSSISTYEFMDVFSTEDWALDMIQQPVAAVLMLYPLTDKQEEYRKQHKENVLDVTKPPSPSNDDKSNKKEVVPWFIKQRIGNACGTIGLLHAMFNSPDELILRKQSIKEHSWLDQFQLNCPKSLTPIEKAEILESNNDIITLHDDATTSNINSTTRGSINDKIITHFITFVCISNILYELDGRKDGPINHGPTTQQTLLKDSCQIIKQFMNRDPNEMRFTITTFAPKQQQF